MRTVFALGDGVPLVRIRHGWRGGSSAQTSRPAGPWHHLPVLLGPRYLRTCGGTLGGLGLERAVKQKGRVVRLWPKERRSGVVAKERALRVPANGTVVAKEGDLGMREMETLPAQSPSEESRYRDVRWNESPFLKIGGTPFDDLSIGSDS